MSTISFPNTLKYSCEHCDIQTDNKKDYNNHLLTRKHAVKTDLQHLATKESQIPSIIKCHICDKEYESRSGLWRHEKKCVIKQPPKEHSESDIKILTNLIMELVKSNTDLQKQVLDVFKNQ
jgi:hypothetical protein